MLLGGKEEGEEEQVPSRKFVAALNSVIVAGDRFFSKVKDVFKSLVTFKNGELNMCGN